jgi:lipopolysaccharide export system permease protein
VFTSVLTLFPPVLSRHLLRAFLTTAALCLAAFVAIALIVDFFDRFEGFIHHGASTAAIFKYFLLRAPLFVTRAAPLAILAGILLGFGGLGRHNEFVALRAAGVGIWQIAIPPLAAAVVISGLMFLWNERVVPYAAQQARDVYAFEIRSPQGFNRVQRRVWYRGRAGFYNIRRVSTQKKALAGLTVYQLGKTFRPIRVVEVEKAVWNGASWDFVGARAYRLRRDGRVESASVDEFRLPEPPEALVGVDRDAEEFSFVDLRRHIDDLRHKGGDPSEYLVDLHLKLAVPLVCLVMVMVGIPLATKGTRTTNLAGAVAFGLGIGFCYFVVLAFARALGQGGAIDPVVAAWTANAIFGLVGVFLFLGGD